MDDTSLWAPWTSSMIDDSVIESIRPLMHIRHFAKEKIIYCQGDNHPLIYILLEGIIEISDINVDGRKRIITIHEAKCIFGETILAGSGYSSTVTCLTPVTAGIIDISKIDWAGRNSQFLLAVIYSLTKKLIITGSQLRMQSFDVTERVEGLLIALAKQYGHISKNEIRLQLPLTHQMIADIVGSTRARVSQSLGNLRKKKNISIYKKDCIHKKSG